MSSVQNGVTYPYPWNLIFEQSAWSTRNPGWYVDLTRPPLFIAIYGRFGGGGGSDTNSEFFQFSPFFSKISFRGEGYVTIF